MRKRVIGKRLREAGCALVFLAGNAAAQMPDLPRLKNFTAHRTSSSNRYVGSNDDSKRIMPGETLVMADLTGPGVVSHIWLTVADNEFAWPRLVRLRVYYDGKKTPSVDVPLGDFFGVGHGYEREVESLPIRNSSYGRAHNSYWSMPFQKSCRITVTDEGKRPVTMFYYHVDWQKHPSIPEDIAYFHGYYRQERPAAMGKNYEFLNVKGTGHYVGTVLNVIQAGVGWFGEGDDLFFVDAAVKPQIYGTGTEDYLSDAWGLRVATGPWSGTPVAEGELIGARLSGYRWHVPDPIPFTKSLWAGIEHAGWTYQDDGKLRSSFEQRPDYFSSAAFWYQKGVNEDLPEPPYGDDRLPLGNALQIAVEDSIGEVKVAKGKVSVQREVDWGRDLLFFEGEGPGSRIDIPIDVPNVGRYEILARIAQAPDYGNYLALLDGKPMNLDSREALTSEMPTSGPAIFQNYLPEVYVAVEHPLGWVQLDKGRHTLSFVCVGRDGRSTGYFLGINDVVLERVPETAALPGRESASPYKGTEAVYRGRPLAEYRRKLAGSSGTSRAAILRSIGAFREEAGIAAAEVAHMLGDHDREVRIAAAWAFSQMGSAGAKSVPELAKCLADPDPLVRSLSAVALRSIGPKAVDAVPALIQALNDSEPTVRAPAADALGTIGPAAKQAVRALSERLLVSGEVIYVLRSEASALGNIGADAVSALPALREVLKITRVTATAEEAILKINRQPVSSWY
ncbi:MAG TPA: DUF2961 domain-containing protein [Bryobacteraceae bacterium]|jgi:hypothetical protein|nr:DUF2961 domain-containing protein [Bryobacteraceae bacterium]